MERFGFGDWILTDENVQKLTGTINGEVLPRHLRQLETVLAYGGTGWLAGTEQPTIADFFWVPTLQLLQQGAWNGDANLFTPFTKLQALIKRFSELPQVKDYYSKPKATP